MGNLKTWKLWLKKGKKPQVATRIEDGSIVLNVKMDSYEELCVNTGEAKKSPRPHPTSTTPL